MAGVASIIHESFSIAFEGPATQAPSHRARAIAGSLSALDDLVRKASHVVFGRHAQTEVGITAGNEAGRFEVVAAIRCAELAPGSAPGIVAVLADVINLCRWVGGKALNPVSGPQGAPAANASGVAGIDGRTQVFDGRAIGLYGGIRVRQLLGRLTQGIDTAAIGRITLAGTGDQAGVRAVIDADDRVFFRDVAGCVLTDNESVMILEVADVPPAGSCAGWRFREAGCGADGNDGFEAQVTDGAFLDRAAKGEFTFAPGSCIRAVVRAVQYMGRQRVVLARTVVDVPEVFGPGRFAQAPESRS